MMQLFLPRIRDWWARRNTQAALEMTEQVIKQLEQDVRLASDIRFLVLHVYRMLSAAVLSAAAFITVILVVMAISQFATDQERVGATRLLLLFVPALYVLWFFAVVSFEYNRNVAMLQNFIAHRARTVIRLERLLGAAGLNSDQVKEWLDRVPPVPRSD
jgi:hypothetical protein